MERLDQAGYRRHDRAAKPPEAGNFRPTGGLTAGHQNRLDDTLRKSGSSLAVVGFLVDELLELPALSRVGNFKGLDCDLIMPAVCLFAGNSAHIALNESARRPVGAL